MFFRSNIMGNGDPNSLLKFVQSEKKPLNPVIKKSKKRRIHPEIMGTNDAKLLLTLLHADSNKSIYDEDDLKDISLRKSVYEPLTQPPVLLMMNDPNQKDRRYLYLIGAEFCDGKYGVKIYYVKGFFTLYKDSIYYKKTPNLLIKKQIHSNMSSYDRSVSDYHFNLLAGYSKPNHFIADDPLNPTTTFFLIDRIKGQTVEKIIKQRLNAHQRFVICREMILALKLIHRLNIVHRDIKPGNIMVNMLDEYKSVVRIFDFDMSKLITINDAGSTPGTVGYVAPEVYRNENTDFKSDIYSLGIVMSELLEINYLLNPAKLKEETDKQTFILLDKYAYSTAITGMLFELLQNMTSLNRGERYTLDEADSALARIIFKSLIENMEGNQKSCSCDNTNMFDSLNKLVVEGKHQDIINIINVINMIHDFQISLGYKLNEYDNLKNILITRSFEAISNYIGVYQCNSNFQNHVINFRQNTLNELLYASCEYGELSLIQFLIKNGASRSYLFKCNLDFFNVDHQEKHAEIDEYFKILDVIDNFPLSNNRFTITAIEHLKSMSVQCTVNQLKSSLKILQFIEESYMNLITEFKRLPAQINEAMIHIASEKIVQLFMTTNNIDTIKNKIAELRDHIILAFALSLIDSSDTKNLAKLMDNYPDLPNASLNDGTTMLHIAAQNNNVDVVRLLLSRGCSPDKKRNDGLTPRQIACMYKYLPLEEMFRNSRNSNHFGIYRM